jgi:nucleoside-diphosphate-sugar epimerase
MKILIVGNLGYIGPTLVRHLRLTYPHGTLIGFDIGYFAHCLTHPIRGPELDLDTQVFGDVRRFPEALLQGVDAVINLAAISNDPMSAQFEDVTMAINHRACVELARKAKAQGVKAFAFASSCSMYGLADDTPRREGDALNPLTAYARSKFAAEEGLAALADHAFTVTCNRFATACGWSSRLRLDLVLNDFVAGSLVNAHISILSDGTPWRPMINTRDMARALTWSATRPASTGGQFLAVNTGSNDWNTNILSLAEATAKAVPGVKITVNPNAPPDKRSYRANFDLFQVLAPNHQPQENLLSTVEEMRDNLVAMKFNDPHYRSSQLIRLEVVRRFLAQGRLSQDLTWIGDAP